MIEDGDCGEEREYFRERAEGREGFRERVKWGRVVWEESGRERERRKRGKEGMFSSDYTWREVEKIKK